MAIIGLALLLLAGLILAWLLVVLHTAWILRHPPRRGYAFAVARGLPGDPSELPSRPALPDKGFSKWTIVHKGISIPVWDVPGENPSAPRILVLHGWGDSRVVMLSRLPTLTRHASRVLLVDLPGHGDAGGTCSLGLTEPDVLPTILDRAAVDKAVLYGFSLGAGVAIASAAHSHNRFLAVIAEAPYRHAITPARNVLQSRALPCHSTLVAAFRLLGFSSRIADAFDRVRLAAQLQSKVPLLVLHATGDEISPIEDGRAIAHAAGGHIIETSHCTHTTMWTQPEAHAAAANAVSTFLATLSPGLSHHSSQAAPGEILA